MLKSIMQPMMRSMLVSMFGDSGESETPPPFDYDSNTYWWDFRSTQTNNVIDTLGDDTMAYAYEAISGLSYKGLESTNKNNQPLVKTSNGIDFNKTVFRRFNFISTTGIANATNGWYVAFNMKPTTVSTTVLRISGASTATNTARGWVDLAGGTSAPQIRGRIGNNDSSSLTTLGLTPSAAIPNVATGLWTTVEVEVNISGGTAVMRAWINGTLQTLSSPATPTHTTTFLATNPNSIVVGNTLGASDTNSFDGEIQQMVFYNGVPSSDIRSSISSYLAGIKP
jgi:hypothetical protein